MLRKLVCLLAILSLLPVETVLSEARKEESDAIPSLKDIYAGLFDFGTAPSPMECSHPLYRPRILEQFNLITPGNELKPDSVLDVKASRKQAEETGDETAVAIRLTSVKPLLDFARDNGLKVHGHVLVWHNQTPEAFFHVGYDKEKPLVTREIMLGRLENYTRRVLTETEAQYPGLIVSWDVLNEAIDDGTNGLRNSNWLKIIGEDYPNQAFAFARKYAAEGVLLYYNDYNTAYPGKLRGILKLVKSLMADGTIDGYGFQMHHSLAEPSIEMIGQALDAVAALGLRMRVSELDITTKGKDEEQFQQQAVKYARIMKLLIPYSDQLEAVQVWGLADNLSWRREGYPLLFDNACQPKPAFWAVADPDSVLR